MSSKEYVSNTYSFEYKKGEYSFRKLEGDENKFDKLPRFTTTIINQRGDPIHLTMMGLSKMPLEEGGYFSIYKDIKRFEENLQNEIDETAEIIKSRKSKKDKKDKNDEKDKNESDDENDKHKKNVDKEEFLKEVKKRIDNYSKRYPIVSELYFFLETGMFYNPFEEEWCEFHARTIDLFLSQLIEFVNERTQKIPKKSSK